MITAIGFDADDTLWHNERHFRLTEAHFTDLLSAHADRDIICNTLLETEKRNLRFYGFGVKGFTLSLIETALEVTGGKVSAAVIGDILAAGRELLHTPVEALPHAREALQVLSGSYQIILVTKGDLFDQERKLAQSGLGDFFNAVEIVSDKTAETYRRVFARHGDGAEHALMAGNSLKSDVIPALEAGAWAVHVPYELTWALERADPPHTAPRFRVAGNLGELAAMVGNLGEN